MSVPPAAILYTLYLFFNMSQQQHAESIQKEGQLQLAKFAIEQGQIQSNREAARVYDANQETLRQRRAGRLSRRDCTPNSRKLMDLEENVII